MAAESGYDVAVVIVNRHEPEHQVTGRLLEIAEERGYSPRVVEAKRGEYDAGLAFRVPEDVAEAFNAERSGRWNSKIENDEETPGEQDTSVAGDAYAADNLARAQAAREANSADDELVDDDGDPNTPPVRRNRAAKPTKE